MYLKCNIDGPQLNILYKNESENDLEIFLNELNQKNIHYEIVGKEDDGIEIKIIFENEEEKNQFEEENKENDKIEFLCKNPKCKDDEYFNITDITCQSKK